MMALVGALIGGVVWFEVDRTLALAHIAGWLSGGIAVFVPFAFFIDRNPVRSFTVESTGFTIVRANGSRRFAWTDIEVARFQDYPIAHSGGQTIRCLLLRAAGETFELTPEFSDDATRDAFAEALLCQLESHDIPETSRALPSFERMLSLAGAWLFVASIVGILAAHAAGFHTLGTVFGLALLLTGSVIAGMTRHQRISRAVLAATLVLIVVGSGILWACHVNVREVLQKWESIEKQ